MNIHTRSQKLAQQAFDRVSNHAQLTKEYISFAKKFPALIHTCGLAQAVAFALAKKGPSALYVNDLAAVLARGGHEKITTAQVLDRQSSEQTLSGYLRLCLDAIEAAVWLKRYVEAVAPAEPQETD